MSLVVVFRQTALRSLARIRNEDKDLFAQARQAIVLLAGQPYPDSAVAWGAQASTACIPAASGCCMKSMMRRRRC